MCSGKRWRGKQAPDPADLSYCVQESGLHHEGNGESLSEGYFRQS